MMLAYILRLVILVPLVGGLAFGTLWLWRRFQPGMALGGARERAVRVVDGAPLGATTRLAVVEFADKRLLLAVGRGGVTLLAEAPAPAPFTLPEVALDDD